MKKTAYIILIILVMIVLAFIALVKQANADTAEPGQHRAVVFLPMLYQQCRVGEDCAVVVPTAQPECDLKYWWECP